MFDIIEKLPDWVHHVAVALSGLVIMATAIAQLTPTPKDDEVVSKVSAVINKILAWLPTIGINPKAKAMAMKEQKEKDKKQ